MLHCRQRSAAPAASHPAAAPLVPLLLPLLLLSLNAKMRSMLQFPMLQLLLLRVHRFPFFLRFILASTSVAHFFSLSSSGHRRISFQLVSSLWSIWASIEPTRSRLFNRHMAMCPRPARFYFRRAFAIFPHSLPCCAHDFSFHLACCSSCSCRSLGCSCCRQSRKRGFIKHCILELGIFFILGLRWHFSICHRCCWPTERTSWLSWLSPF